MRVLFLSSEIYPLAKTGGLADASAGLSRALSDLGVDMRLAMPGYPRALLGAADKRVVTELPDFGGQGVTRVIGARMPDSGLPIWLIDCPALFDREGTPYQDQHGDEWPDNAERFAHLSRVAAKIATGELVAGWQADVVHANDWHTGLLPLLVDGAASRPPILFTIHNLAFQGLFPVPLVSSLGLPQSVFVPEGIEFYGNASFLKAGIRYSDRLTTVSPAYAREILTHEHGCGLDGLLRDRADALTGILNGVDNSLWNPAADPHLPAHFSGTDVSGKRRCKVQVQKELGLQFAPDVPLFIWISRITHQKMADTAADILPALLERNLQVAILGEGDVALENRFRAIAEQHPGRAAVWIGYEEPLAHRLYAGGDLLLHPARFEPCGLTPLYALRYGTIPIVRTVGGLADTIVPATEDSVCLGTATGVAFDRPTADGLLESADRALDLYAQPGVWRRIQHRGMTQDFGWDRSARRYQALYHELAPAAPCEHEEQPSTAFVGVAMQASAA
jgi:starch synthase